MSNVITGFSIDVPADEMVQHAKSRAKYHGERAKAYLANITETEKLLKSAEQISGSIGKGGSSSPTAEMERATKAHQQKERFFTFSAEHFVAGATYRLNQADLQVFEIMPAAHGY